MVNKFVFPIIRDLILLLLVGALALAHQLDFRVGANLHIRGWFRYDISNSLPLKPDTVTPLYAALFAFLYPLALMVVLWFACDRIWSNSFENNDTEAIIPPSSSSMLQDSSATAPMNNTTEKRDVFNWGQDLGDSSPRGRKLRWALYQFFILAFGMCLVIIVTTAIKLMVGRLRPDFIARCQPDYNNPDLVFGMNDWVDGKYAFICTGHEAEIIEGRKSFPSAHSSTSLYGGTIAALLLWRRCWNRGQRAVGFIVVPFFIIASISGGLLIAASRNWDNRHFATDIIAGSIIGIVIALFTLCFNAYTPSWERDGTLINEKGTNLNQTTNEV